MPVEILMPELGESVHEATVSRWIVKEGDFVKEDDPVVEIMTDKVNTELPSPATGVLSKILVPEGGSVHVFEPMGIIEESGQAGAAKSAPKTEKAPERAAVAAEPSVERAPTPPKEVRVSADGKKWFTPVVRAIAKERGLTDAELSTIKGSGSGGRVTKADVETYLSEKKVSAPTVPAQAPPSMQEKPLQMVIGPEQEIVPLAPMRKMIAEAMERAHQVPTVTTTVQVDVTTMVRFREANKDAFQNQHGVKLTYTAFFIKALTEALLEFPIVNGSLQGEKVVLNRAVHMGVAVALGTKGDEGLIVPVVRDCHKKNLVEITRDLESLAEKARNNGLKPSDVQGGTFTLTNPGSYGALFGTPMIVAPQAGIAGAYGIQMQPVVVAGEAIAIRDVMYLVLTYDHRIIDGLLAGRFLQSVKRKLEEFEFFK